MFKRLVLVGLVFLAIPCYASRITGSVVIVGVDQQCTSFTPSVSGGDTLYTCNGAPVPPGAPTNCQPTVNGGSVINFPSAGGVAHLSVACTQTSGVLYNWSRNGLFGANTNAAWNDTLPMNGGGSAVNYTYQVRACIGSACVTVPSSPLVATVAAAGGFTGSCPGFATTNLVTMNWASPSRLAPITMGANDIVIVQFTTGNVSTTTSLETLSGAEWSSPPSSRIATLSSTPCDFSAQTAPGANIGPSNSITAKFGLGTGTGFSYYPVLNLNSTFYLNIKNAPSPTCASGGICDLFMDLLKVGGT